MCSSDLKKIIIIIKEGKNIQIIILFYFIFLSIHEKLELIVFHFFEQPFFSPGIEDPQYLKQPGTYSI